MPIKLDYTVLIFNEELTLSCVRVRESLEMKGKKGHRGEGR